MELVDLDTFEYLFLFKLDENKIGDQGMRMLVSGGKSMPKMEYIYLRMCIRYDLGRNNIRMPLLINKVP